MLFFDHHANWVLRKKLRSSHQGIFWRPNCILRIVVRISFFGLHLRLWLKSNKTLNPTTKDVAG